jgi:hypothetical protein
MAGKTREGKRMSILRLSEALFGAEIRASVFEPLLADRAQEIAARPSMTLRVRWWIAIASALVSCAPRATFGRLPSSLVLDLSKRAIGFGTVAYALQWVVLGLATSRGRSGYVPSMATAMPFLVIPVIWRIWVSSIPRHQKRLMTTALAATFIALSAAGTGGWMAWLGYSAVITWLTAYGWRLGNPNFPEFGFQSIDKGWQRLVMVASALMIANWPVRLPMIIGVVPPSWPRYQMIATFILACLITLYIDDLPAESQRKA